MYGNEMLDIGSLQARILRSYYTGGMIIALIFWVIISFYAIYKLIDLYQMDDEKAFRLCDSTRNKKCYFTMGKCYHAAQPQFLIVRGRHDQEANRHRSVRQVLRV